ncbi:MAG: sigma-54-dependent Fis family transcriptional regulator [Bryobacteraceae bacterium]|nr:sigma-54-dependent Fis family transcriptional regulator [Bryobacteraceae bacterium]
MARLLVVEDDSAVRNTVVTFLELENYSVDAVSSTRAALERLSGGTYDIVVSDIYLDERTGLDVLHAAKLANPSCVVILMTGRGTMETVMRATQGGAFDYIAKPFELDRLLDTIKRAESSLLGSVDSGDDEVEIDDVPETEMVASSAAMVDIYKLISRIAPTDVSVLIQGETGTGKELIARMIHKYSKRADKPFVAVDCGAISPTLIESELFGALRGAYTGSDRDRVGYLEAANGGTVFLDEIGEIDTAFQLKLLRFLQEKEIRPVGSPRSRQVDVRVVAATNRDLKTLISEGKFREDLWYRLATVPLQVPPLRERRGDVPLLAQHLTDRSNRRFGTSAKLTESGVRALAEYSWPGNVRQMQHAIERLCILAPGARLDESAVRSVLQTSQPKEAAGDTLADTEADQIRRVLAAAGGNKSRAAKILGIERKTLYRKLERIGLHETDVTETFGK